MSETTMSTVQPPAPEPLTELRAAVLAMAHAAQAHPEYASAYERLSNAIAALASQEAQPAAAEALRKAIDGLYSAALSGIAHVGTANYEHRELEARQWVRAAMEKVNAAMQSPQGASDGPMEALRRLREWGGFMAYGGEKKWSGTIVCDVLDWFDAGARGPLPPLPEWAQSPQGASGESE